MKYLYKLFYQYDNTEFQKMYDHRLSSDSIARIDLSIKPIDQPNIFELYYLPTNKIIDLIANIYSLSGDLTLVFNQLPSVAKNQFIIECLIEELFNTNELEGVKSSRAEIAESVKNVQMSKKSKKRFNSMVKSYFTLINDKLSLPEFPMDIRKIYDEITAGEIEEGELPDGDIFREDITHVLAKSGNGNVIHRGLHPEAEIIKETEKLLKFMNEEDSIPSIIKVAIGHYYFGFIHPFYDGNGRTSRFISSLYLSQTLGKIPALSLSRGCNKMKNKYLEAFEKTNSISNKGELNFFIDTFLNIIFETLSEMNAELKEKVELLNSAEKKLESDPQLTKKNYYDFMFILAQNHFFQVNEGLTIKNLAKEMDLSESTIRKIKDELLEKSLIKQKGIRPAYLSIKPEYFE
ncbi:Fic family protein [Pseudogracilibacillus sp. ICA-222130]|uniref:Fic family protein n=1 Tax=Pseudogracilibacillus sp. ICA-222130 TaxID=3134655 RepID=UPI0030C1A01C